MERNVKAKAKAKAIQDDEKNPFCLRFVEQDFFGFGRSTAVNRAKNTANPLEKTIKKKKVSPKPEKDAVEASFRHLQNVSK